jgi:hypothetical protein
LLVDRRRDELPSDFASFEFVLYRRCILPAHLPASQWEERYLRSQLSDAVELHRDTQLLRAMGDVGAFVRGEDARA